MTDRPAGQDVENRGTANGGDEESPDIVGPVGEESTDASHDAGGEAPEAEPPVV